MNGPVRLSVIIPVTERVSDVEPLYRAYRKSVESAEDAFEFIYVLDGDYPDVFAELKKLKAQGEPIKIISFSKWFGEATALTVGFSHARGDILLTLPAYLQVQPDEIPRLLTALEGNDMVVARRFPRRDSKLNVLQSKLFHLLLRLVVQVPFHDLGCGVRVLRRRVVEQLNIYGDQHRFLPLLAQQQGFRVIELDLAQAKEDAFQRVYPLGVYVRRILDILTIVFILKFTKKPLRFFGLIGSSMLGVGALTTVYVIIERLFFGVPLADRPVFLLGALLIVLGFQMVAVGLIGELIIFTHAKDVKEYTIDEIVE